MKDLNWQINLKILPNLKIPTKMDTSSVMQKKKQPNKQLDQQGQTQTTNLP